MLSWNLAVILQLIPPLTKCAIPSFYGCGDSGLASLSHVMKNPVVPYLKKWGEVLSPDNTSYCKETEAFG